MMESLCFFYAQARIWNLAVSQHAGRAASSGEGHPLLDCTGKVLPARLHKDT